MPYYSVTAITGRFSPDQKARLAEAVTDIHCNVTGAPRFLVTLVFNEVAVGDCFIGGKGLKFDNVLVHGHVEGGYSCEIKKHLVADLLHAVALIGETDRSAVQIYITDVPAQQIAEWGQVLVRVGDETFWEHVLPKDVQHRRELVEASEPETRHS